MHLYLITPLTNILYKEGQIMKSLHELTWKESGIVIYEDQTAIGINWAHINGAPRLYGIVAVGLGEEFDAVEIQPPMYGIEMMKRYEQAYGFDQDELIDYRAWELTVCETGEKIIVITSDAWD